MAALVGYLLVAPPVFVFGPLAALLLLSRPATVREWIWLVASMTWSVLWLQQVGGLGAQVIRAGAVLLCGAFLALTLWQPSNAVGRALGATAMAATALALWMVRLEIGWSRLVGGVDREWYAYATVLRDEWRRAGASQEVIDQAGSVLHSAAQLFPGLLAVAAVAGLRLAWMWYHRLAQHPIGQPPGPFRSFAFNDQLVWGIIVSLALSLAPVPAGWNLAGANLLIVFGVLYATQGLAVVVSQAGALGWPVALAVSIVSVFLLPFVVGGLALLGLADTWLDFRRRRSAPAT